MIDLRLKLTTTGTEAIGAGNTMAFRFMGLRRRLMLVAAAFLCALALGVVASSLMGVPLGASLMIAFYACFGALVGLVVVARLNNQRLGAEYSRSALREPVDVTLGDDGIALSPRRLPWARVSGVARWKDATLVMASGADGLVIPDRDLPDRMTAAALRERIEAFRAGRG